MNRSKFIYILGGILALFCVVGLVTYLSMSSLSNQNVEPEAVTAIPDDSGQATEKTAVFANGCFWCVESDLEKVEGVSEVVSGYAGGTSENPTYENYSAGGHREVVLVTYDESKVSFANLVEHIIKHGDPTDAEGSFGDRGSEYAPALYYDSEEEKMEAMRVISAVDDMKVFPGKLPLLVLPRTKFWPAEEYHQDYAKKNPIRYNFYRTASGRDAFIQKYWGDRAERFEIAPGAPVASTKNNQSIEQFTENSWNAYVKPLESELRKVLSKVQFSVTQEDDTEAPFNNIYDKEYREGIYVDIVSGEPLFLSKDKYDSGTGWPSFVKPISSSVVSLHEDNTFFAKRTEVRSAHADSHLGHVFDDGPVERGGKRYCMNSAALRFIPKEEMGKEGYAYLLSLL